MSFQISDLQAYASRFYGGAPILLTPYAYTATFGTIADTAIQQVLVNIASNADFIVSSLEYNVLQASNATANTRCAACQLQIEDTGSNEKFFNSPVMLDNIANNTYAQQAFAFPRFVSGKTALQVNLTNISGLFNIAETYDGIDVILSGVLVRVFSQ